MRTDIHRTISRIAHFEFKNALCELFGDASVLEQARRELPRRAVVLQALDDMEQLARAHAEADCAVQIDLADLRGYHYHTGVIFGIYAADRPDALARGGRYDEIGASYGRSRPATGFSLDLRELVRLSSSAPPRSAVRAEWSAQPGYARAVRELREQGEVVVELPPGAAFESDGLRLDRALSFSQGRWQVSACEPAGAP